MINDEMWKDFKNKIERITADESLSTYILLYLNEEVKQEGLVRNLGEF